MLAKVLIDDKEINMYCDGWLYNKILKWLASIKKDDDLVIVVDGPERSGKSTLGQQIAKLLDPNFKIENICMNANSFKKKIQEAKRGDAIIYDEAFTGLSSKRSLSEINKILVELMMEMGQKNLKVIIILPTFFMLEKYVALFRATALFHVYKKGTKKGYWRYYGMKKKRLLYVLGKKLFSYKEPISRRRGRFLPIYTVNEDKYREIKARSFQQKDRTTRDEKFKMHRDILLWYLCDELGLTQESVAELFNCFDIDFTREAFVKTIRDIEDRIKAEVNNPPTNEMLLNILDMITNRNRIVKDEKRRKKTEEIAKKEIERTKRRIAKEELFKAKAEAKKPQNVPLIPA